MDRTFFKICLALLAGLLLAGCGGYSKILKSKDNELRYRKGIEYFEAGKYQKTIQLFEEIAYYFNGTSREDTIAYYLGTSYYKQGDFEASGMYFDHFRKTFGRSPFLEDAEYMYAKGYYYLSPSPNRDQGATNLALIAINEYLDRYPNSAKREAMEENITELIGKLHDKAYINSKLYYNIKRYKAASVALKNALAQYPDTRHREEMLYLIAKSDYLLASNSLESLQRDRYLDMMDSYYNFVSEYPQSRHRRELDRMEQNTRKYLAKFNDTENNEENSATQNGN